MLKSLLVHLAGGERDAAPIEAATRLALRHGAHLEAVFIEPESDMPAGALGRGASAAYLEEATDAAGRAASLAERRFRAAATAAGLPSVRWARERGGAAAVLARRSRTVDLVVLGRDEDGALLESVLDAAAGPILAVPRRGTTAPPGENALVAWDESAQAARALRGALPLLRRAARTVLLLVGDDAALRDRLAPVQGFLQRHGIEAEPLVENGPETGVGEIIAARADELGCDLVVMGAFGHSRLAELLLGGTTRDLLNRATVPLLLSR